VRKATPDARLGGAMEFQPGFIARPDELAHHQRWRERYAHQGERRRRYEPDRRRSLIRRFSGFLDARVVCHSLADLPRGSLVLDLPCGGGRLSRALISTGLRPVAADFSTWMLAESAGATAHRVRANAFRLPFRDDVFAAAVCFRFMQAAPFELRLRVLKELCRVSPRLVVNYQNIFSLRNLRRFLQGRPIPLASAKSKFARRSRPLA